MTVADNLDPESFYYVESTKSVGSKIINVNTPLFRAIAQVRKD